MSYLLLSLWPIFVLIMAGYVMRVTSFLGETFWPNAERLNYYILFPALLFSSLSRAPLEHPALPRVVVAVILVIGLGTAGLLLARRFNSWPASRFGVLLQGLLRFNVYLGLAAVSGLYGSDGMLLAAVILGILVPTVNVLSILGLSDTTGGQIKTLIFSIAKNPLILGCVAGGIANVASIELKWGIERLLTIISNISLPLGLLCVGAALRPDQIRMHLTAIIGNSLARLFLMPGLALYIAHTLSLPKIESAVLILFFALPTAPNAYILTKQLGGESALMAGIITFQTFLSALSLLIVLTATM
jgi:predicted permease